MEDGVPHLEGRPFVRPSRLFLGGSLSAMSNPAFTFDHIHIISQTLHASAKWYVNKTPYGRTLGTSEMSSGTSALCG